MNAAQEKITHLAEAAQRADVTKGITFLTTDDILKLPDVQWIRQGWFFRGGVTMIYGTSGIGKSYITMNEAANLGLKNLKTLYVATEGVYSYKGRMAAWRKHYGQTADRLIWYTKPVDLFDEKSAAEFITAVSGAKPDLVIFDVISDCIGAASENDSSDMKTVVGHMKDLAHKCDCAVGFVHHTAKTNDSYRGSSVLKSNTDISIEIAQSGDGVVVICDKVRPIEKWKPERYDFISVDLGNGSNQVPLRAAQVIPEKSILESRMELVLKELAQNTNGLKRKQIVTQTHLSESIIKNKVLPALMEQGLIAHSGRSMPYILTDAGKQKVVLSDK